jgi:predicted dehydrogenase
MASTFPADLFDPARRDFLLAGAGALTAMAIFPELSVARSLRGADPLNVALVGCGRQGRAIIGELQKIENVKIVAVCDTDESRASGAARRVEGAEVFTDHKAMLDKRKDIAAVVVATPTHLHRQPVVDCLSAGKHVYCEAPMAHTMEDAKAIAAAASAAGKLVTAIGHEGRSNPVYQLARTFFRSDAVRDVIACSAHQYQKTTWRFPGSDARREADANWRLNPELSLGLPGEWGSHQFDVAHWYLDELPVSVRGGGAVRFHADGRTVADTVHAELLFKEGVRMQYDASLCTSYLGRAETFRGINATIRLAWSHGWMFKEADAPTQGWEVYANRQQFHNDEGITLIAGATKLAEQGKLKEGVGLPHPSLYYSLWDFAEACVKGKAPTVSAAAALKTTAVAIAAAEACAKGTEVKIDAAIAGSKSS